MQARLCIYTLLAVFCSITVLMSVAWANETPVVTPQYTLTITNPYEQYNDIHPTWSSNGKYISFERYDASAHKIIISDRTGNVIQTVAVGTDTTFSLDNLLNNSANTVTFNSGISWAPDGKQFVFTSSGNHNNFDLYISKLGSNLNKRITYQHQKDSHASWSSDGRYIVFVSSRGGRAALYRFETQNGETIRLLSHSDSSFYPVWSPDSRKLAFMQSVNGVFQIFIIDDIEHPNTSLRAITRLDSMSLRPSWSADGKQLAFFHLNRENDDEPIWDIVLANIDDKTPVSNENLIQHTVASNVIINSESGPTWLAQQHYLAYVKNINDEYNPIYLLNLQTSESIYLNTKTNLNKDLACSADGVLAFQSQDKQWSRIFISKLPDLRG